MVRNFSVQKADELWTVLVFYLPWEAKLVTKHCAGQTVCATTQKTGFQMWVVTYQCFPPMCN
jgi:hypothetical protein